MVPRRNINHHDKREHFEFKFLDGNRRLFGKGAQQQRLYGNLVADNGNGSI
jgi:hypothetical protein